MSFVLQEKTEYSVIDANQRSASRLETSSRQIHDATFCMYEVIKAGGFTNGGLNFDSKARRGSFTMDDIFNSYIAGMDTFALGYSSF